MVCVDGSDQSEVAFDATMNLRKKYDHVSVFHAFKGGAEDIMPPCFKPNRIKENYEVKLIGSIPSSRFSMKWEDRKGRPVLETLHHAMFKFSTTERTDLPEGRLPDFVVMGHHGRKGPKESPTALGSNTDQALRTLHLPCIIIKTPVHRGPRSYIMAVNGTETSHRGLDILLRLVNPRDSVRCVYMTNPDEDPEETEPLKEYYDRELQEFGPVDSAFMTVEKPQGQALTKALADYVNNSDCDFFAIAPRAKHRLSSVSEYVINHIKCNVMLCKN